MRTSRIASGLLVLGSILLAGVLPSSAAAVTRNETYYAAGDNSGSGSTCSQQSRCSLATAIGKADAIQIYLAGGVYTLPDTLEVPAFVNLQGASAANTYLSVANAAGTPAVHVNTSATVSRLRITSAAGEGVWFENGGNGSQVDVRADGNACVAKKDPVVLDNSVCAVTSSSSTANAFASDAANFAMVTLRNDTLVAETQPLRLAWNNGGSASLSNTIVFDRSAGPSDCPTRLSGPLSFTTSGSAYRTLAQGCYSNTTTFSETGTVTAPPQFVDAAPASGRANYHEAAGSPTIAAGTTSGSNGTEDLEGSPRTRFGDDATDVGAYQYIQPPTVTVGAVSGLTATGVTLNGAVNDHGVSAESTFSYGLAPGDPDTDLATHSQPASVSDQPVADVVSGLSPATTYTYRLCSLAYVSTCSALQQFTTLPLVPVISAAGAADIAQTSATLRGTVNPGKGATTAHFEFGTTATYGRSTADQSVAGSAVDQPLTASLTGLLAGTAYHGRVVATNAAGTAMGPDFTFTTVTATGAGGGAAAGGGVLGGGTIDGDGGVKPPAPFGLHGQATVKKGVVTISVDVPGSGALAATATYKAKKAAKKAAKAAKVSAPVTYGKAALAPAAAGTIQLVIKPSAAAKRALKKARKLALTVTVAFTPKGGKAVTKSLTITVKP